MAGGSFEHEYDSDYIEGLVLIVLLLLALTFESIWHRIQEWVREHAYHYGSLHDCQLAEVEARPSGLDADECHPRISQAGKQKHVKLAEELVNRAGGEFMTLGFLAFCTFVFNNLNGFGWIVATCPPSGDVPLPRTEVDWLHLVESVHMKLFVGMVFYFALISRVVTGAIRKIQKWEQMQLRYAKGQTTDLTRVSLAVDKDLTEYLVWRSYFIQHLVAIEDQRPALYQALFRELGISRRSPDAAKKLREKIERCFSFSAYISLNVETGVRDEIEVHQLTWCGTILLFGLFAVLHRFAHFSLRSLTPFFIGAAFLILGTMRFTVARSQRKIIHAIVTDSASGGQGLSGTPALQSIASEAGGDRTTLPPSPSGQDRPAQQREPPVSMRASKVLPKQSDHRQFHERWQTELIMNRLLQILLWLISYVFARTVMDFHGWTEKPATTGLLTSLFITLFALLVYFLPSYVPVFLGVMALPPYVDDGNLAAFFGVIEEMKTKDREGTGDRTGDDTLSNDQSRAPTTASLNLASEGFFRGISDSSSQTLIPELANLLSSLEKRVEALEDRAPTLPKVQSSLWRRVGVEAKFPDGVGSPGELEIEGERLPQASAWRCPSSTARHASDVTAEHDEMQVEVPASPPSSAWRQALVGNPRDSTLGRVEVQIV